MGSLSLLQGIFPSQGSNPGLLHCRWILYQLSHQRSPRRLEWVAYPFFRGSSLPRNQTRVSCIAGRFFTSWATREAFLLIRFTKDWPINGMFILKVNLNIFSMLAVVQSLSRIWLLFKPKDHSMPGFSVLHYLPEFAQTHVHWVYDAIQPSHPPSPPSPPVFNLSQRQGLFQWVGSLRQ